MARQKMKRVGTPEEIASAVLHLASDESSYTTGASQRLHLCHNPYQYNEGHVYIFSQELVWSLMEDGQSNRVRMYIFIAEFLIAWVNIENGLTNTLHKITFNNSRRQLIFY